MASTPPRLSLPFPLPAFTPPPRTSPVIALAAWETDSGDIPPFGHYPSPRRPAPWTAGSGNGGIWASAPGWLRGISVWPPGRHGGNAAPVDVRINGLNLRLDGPGAIALAARRQAALAPLLSMVLTQPVAHPVPVVVDLGAQTGVFALAAAAQMARQGRLLIAPTSGPASRHLRANLAFNPAPPAITLLPSPGRAPAPLRARLEAAGLAHVDLLRVGPEGPAAAGLLPFLATAPQTLRPDWLVVDHGPWAYDVAALLDLRGYRQWVDIGVAGLWGPLIGG